MRTTIRVVFLGLVIAALVGVPAASAHRWQPPHRNSIHVSAWAGRAAQGGTMPVRVRVRLPWSVAQGDGAPTAEAVVHFASGDVTVDLTDRGRAEPGGGLDHHAWWAPARVWRGIARVPVAANEQTGRVRVDVTIRLGDDSVTVAVFGRIRTSRTTPTPDPDPEQPPCTQGCEEL